MKCKPDYEMQASRQIVAGIPIGLARYLRELANDTVRLVEYGTHGSITDWSSCTAPHICTYVHLVDGDGTE